MIGRFPPHDVGGAERQADRLAAALVARGHEVTVITRRWSGRAARETRYASIYGTTTTFGPHRPYLRQVAMRAVEQDGALAIWSAYGPTYELYDLEQDPGARVNLVERKPERLEPLRRTLDEFPAHWSRPVPVDELPAAHDEQLRALGYLE